MDQKVIECDACGSYALEATSQRSSSNERDLLIFCAKCWADVQKRSQRDQVERA